jgi:hypothetical protein
MIYVLKLVKHKWYVGYTDRLNGERFEEHRTGKGSKWTQLYPMIGIEDYKSGTLEDENKLTLELMEKYGWWNVRGGRWCKRKMDSPPYELKTPTMIKACDRCGRDTHHIDNCYARTHITGYKLKRDTANVVSLPKICSRCGRNTHSINKCYENTYINGSKLIDNNRS